MTFRPVRSAAALAAFTATFLGFAGLAAPPIAGGELPSAAEALPPCPAGRPESTAVPAGPPPDVPEIGDPAVCRARPTRVEPAGTGQLPVPRPGYHHLGVTTVDGWSGVLGRLAVRDPGVRRDSFDFVATRFMAKQELGGGRIGWLEVGWAETGWSGGGAQRIYTFDSTGKAWVFFDEYELGDGDQVWLYLHSDREAGKVVWRAWLWWGDRWHLLAAPELPIGDRARLEQYVEVHQDGDRAAGRPVLPVPPIRVDNVRVSAAPGEPLQDWRRDTVPTRRPLGSADYCLGWEIEYDSWSAGDCTVQG